MINIPKYQVYIEYLNGSSELIDIQTNNLKWSIDQYSRNRDPFKWSVVNESNTNQFEYSNEDVDDIKSERILLTYLYKCQSLMEELLDGGSNDPHYDMISVLIARLENHLKNNQDLL